MDDLCWGGMLRMLGMLPMLAMLGIHRDVRDGRHSWDTAMLGMSRTLAMLGC